MLGTSQETKTTMTAKTTKTTAEKTTMTFRSTLNSAAAGYVAGGTGVILGHPLDSVKVWVQTNTGGMNKHLADSVGKHMVNSTTSTTTGNSSHVATVSSVTGGSKRPMSAITTSTSATTTLTMTRSMSKSISSTIRALYSGASGPFVTVGIVQSINFATYDAMRRYLHHKDQPDAKEGDYLVNDSLTNVATSGFVAGTSIAFITLPLIQVRTRQQITGDGYRQAFRECFLQTSSTSASAGQQQRKTTTLRPMNSFFVGFYPHFISETMGRALYYTVYEGCKRSIVDYKNSNNGYDDNDASITIQDRMISAAIAGISCWAFIFPFDALRNRLYNQQVKLSLSSPSSSTSSTTSSSSSSSIMKMTIDMIRTMHKEKSFYRGFSLTVLRAGPVAAAVLPVYDVMLETLSSSSSYSS